MNRYRNLAYSLVLAATTALSACGGGGGDIAIDDLADEVVDALCKSMTACDQYPDVATCKESQDIFADQVISDVEAGLVDYDAAKARECVDSFANTDCSRFGSGPEIDACDETFTGSVAIGGACFNSEVCAGNAECSEDESETCTAGVCVAGDADAGIGESCTDLDCEGDLTCNDSDVCQESPAEGEACEQLFDCARGTLCKIEGEELAGVCVTLAASGQACDPLLGGDYFAGRFSCAESTDYCDPTDNICKTNIAVGEACSSDPGNCVNFAECVEGTCVADPTLGEACTVDGQIQCLGSLECENSICTADSTPNVCSL